MLPSIQSIVGEHQQKPGTRVLKWWFGAILKYLTYSSTKNGEGKDTYICTSLHKDMRCDIDEAASTESKGEPQQNKQTKNIKKPTKNTSWQGKCVLHPSFWPLFVPEKITPTPRRGSLSLPDLDGRDTQRALPTEGPTHPSLPLRNCSGVRNPPWFGVDSKNLIPRMSG